MQDLPEPESHTPLLGDLPASPALVRATVGDATRVLLWREQRLIDPGWESLDALVGLRVFELESLVSETSGEEIELSNVDFLAPVESQEVWAAGVTYGKSRDARMEESTEADIYDKVYYATRPEIFFKSAGWRVVHPGHPVGIRSDSGWDVPEPELSVLVNIHGEVMAFAAGNDVSSRSIEADNPLYLPQAKIYDRSCAIGPTAVLASFVEPGTITLTIQREGKAVFEGSAHPNAMIRSVNDLIAAIQNWHTFPLGFWLMTGTGVIPPMEFSLQSGDLVSVNVSGLGTLRNTVTTIGPSSA